MGTHHDETGWLDLHFGQHLLRRDDGGTWQLEFGSLAERRARGLTGRRVAVTGTRIGFDVLSVSSFTAG